MIKKYILVLGKGPIQGLEHNLTADEVYSVNFIVTKKVFCLSLHYYGANICLFVNNKEIVKFKTKDSAIVATRLCLEKISKDWSVNNTKKTGLNGYVYEFSVDYELFGNAVDINKYMALIQVRYKTKFSDLLNDVFYKLCIFSWCKLTKLCINEQSIMRNRTTKCHC